MICPSSIEATDDESATTAGAVGCFATGSADGAGIVGKADTTGWIDSAVCAESASWIYAKEASEGEAFGPSFDSAIEARGKGEFCLVVASTAGRPVSATAGTVGWSTIWNLFGGSVAGCSAVPAVGDASRGSLAAAGAAITIVEAGRSLAGDLLAALASTAGAGDFDFDGDRDRALGPDTVSATGMESTSIISKLSSPLEVS